jgi:hypothetical protein
MDLPGAAFWHTSGGNVRLEAAVSTSDPMLDAMLGLQFVVLALVPLLGNAALIGVAAVRARHVGGSGWLWLAGAGGLGLVSGVVGPVAGMGVSVFGARFGTTTMIGMNVGISLLGALVSLVWWGLLVAGISALVRGQES